MKHLFYLFCILLSCSASSIPSLDTRINLLWQLENANLWSPGQPLRLHLGCGENHFNGYVNIDFPITDHTVQTYSGADINGDIAQLRIPYGTVDEIRNHHVFEHFDRQEALALLCNWHLALKVGGTLVIETPDFEESIKLFLLDSSQSYSQKQAIMRHIFGSHEASWAIHCDGWYKQKYVHVLNLLDFEITHIEQHGWLNIRNITITARKKSNCSREWLINSAQQILLESKVVEGEVKMWETWCHQLRQLVF